MTFGYAFSHKSEENLAIAEAELDKQTNIVNDMTRKVDELQVKADEAARLKDQMDECVYLLHTIHVLVSRFSDIMIGIVMQLTV